MILKAAAFWRENADTATAQYTANVKCVVILSQQCTKFDNFHTLPNSQYDIKNENKMRPLVATANSENQVSDVDVNENCM